MYKNVGANAPENFRGNVLPETGEVNIVLYERYQNYSHQMPDFSLDMHQIQFSAGALLQTPLGELTALPQTS